MAPSHNLSSPLIFIFLNFTFNRPNHFTLTVPVPLSAESVPVGAAVNVILKSSDSEITSPTAYCFVDVVAHPTVNDLKLLLFVLGVLNAEGLLVPLFAPIGLPCGSRACTVHTKSHK